MSETPQGSSNIDRLASFQTGSAGASGGETRAVLPWERPDAPVSPSTPPASQSGAGPASMLAPTTQAAAPGAYRDPNTGLLFRWSGAEWDPRSLAPIWTRVWCFAVDSILAFALAFVIAALLSIPFSLVGSEDAGVIFSLLIMVIVWFDYFALAYVWWGRTPAMMLGHLEVIDLHSGGRLSKGRSALRSLVLTVQLLSGILTIIWLVVTATSPVRQGPHDRAAQSLVVTRR